MTVVQNATSFTIVHLLSLSPDTICFIETSVLIAQRTTYSLLIESRTRVFYCTAVQ